MRFGAHVSIRGALHLAVDRAVAIGCECLQIFTGSPRQWREVTYPERDLDLFVAKRRRAGLDPLVAHAAYLINLASDDPEVYRRSTASLIASLRLMDRLEGQAVVTHLGSRGTRPWAQARVRVVAAIAAALDATGSARVLLEHSAGAGGQVGATFEELAEILEALGHHPRVGVCLDTCHLFAAGWDLRTPDGVRATMRAFDRTVGLRHLHLLHLNDSRGALGSHLDRHENIGQGRIGRRGFAALIAHPRLQRLAGVIETPGFDRQGPDRRNLRVLKALRQAARARRR
ncbi:MAG: deoxyribonuclease IV [Armatimonadota bacterium]|nr:deoxyribonuclease IV [Armatimonadota bacterium]MDR7404159.1 deoxyribonuclease IV [Armatimonadota bacterium]